MSSKLKCMKVVMLAACIVLLSMSVTGQRRECPLKQYDGNWAFGTTQTFYVGDPFDGIGQVEVMRPGRPVQLHEKNRKWELDGVRIRPGEVFTKVGNFIMTIESNGYKTAYKVEVLPAKGPQRPVAKVVSYPVQTEYKVGDRFYIDGIKVVCHDADGKELPVEGKEITFFTSISNTLIGAGSQCGGGYQFNTAGKKVVEVRYNYVTIGKFTINVADNKVKTLAPETKLPATGWYHLRAMNNYLNLDASGSAELRKKTVNQVFYVENKGNNQITLQLANGKYLGITGTIKNGVRVTAVHSAYRWNVYSENDADIFSLRPSTHIKMVVNASGQKNSDGTPIILWQYTAFNAPNHAEFRFIRTKLSSFH